MLKAAGMIFVVIASSALGAGMSRELAERVKWLSELERLMQVLKGGDSVCGHAASGNFFGAVEKDGRKSERFFCRDSSGDGAAKRQ